MAQPERQARVTQKDRFSLLLYRTSLCGCLLGCVGTLYFICGVAGVLANPFPNVACAGVVIFCALFFLYTFFAVIRRQGRWPLVVWLLILVVLTMEVMLSLLPPTARDELTQHLLMPRLYVRAGRFFEIPFAPYSYYPMLLEMLYAPWVKWGWDFAPKIIHGLFGFLTALLLYAYLARRLSPFYGLLGFFLFVFTPAILRLSNLAYVDLGLTFYSTAVLLCLLRWMEESEWHLADGAWRNSKSDIRNPQSSFGDTGWLILGGLSAGFGLTAKPNGFLVLLMVFFVFVFSLGKIKRKDLLTGAAYTLVFLFLAVIPLVPWWYKNLAQTGNPFFPFFGWFFSPRGGGGSVLGVGNPGLGIFVKRQLFFGESWWEIAALPIRIFVSGRDDQPQYFDGVLNPMLILFLPWAFKGKWVHEKKFLFAFAACYFFYALFLVEARIRYVLPVVPPLVILLVYGLHNIYLRIVHPSFLFGVMALLLAFNGVYLWNYAVAVSPIDYWTGRESRDAYLARMLPDYPVYQFINKNLPPKAKIYLLFMGRRAYYCERAYFHDSDDNGWVLLQMVESARSEGDIRVQLQKRGLTHLLVREELLRRFLRNNLPAEKLMLWDGFATRHLGTLFRERGYGIYEIHG